MTIHNKCQPQSACDDKQHHSWRMESGYLAFYGWLQTWVIPQASGSQCARIPLCTSTLNLTVISYLFCSSGPGLSVSNHTHLQPPSYETQPPVAQAPPAFNCHHLHDGIGLNQSWWDPVWLRTSPYQRFSPSNSVLSEGKWVITARQ